MAYNLPGIATDLVSLFQEFLVKMPIFKTIPFYIFCESYGGKMTSAFGVALYEAIHAGEVECNFKGVALGDSWISPVDSTLSWGPYLYSVSLLDEKDLDNINKEANATAEAVRQGDFKKATDLWGATEELIDEATDSVDVYNILRHHVPPPMRKSVPQGNRHLDWLYARHVSRLYGDGLSALMNGPIRKKLGIIPDNVTWGGQSTEVFQSLFQNFMKPVIADVSKLLNYGLKVVVYQGQLDMMCDTPGAEMWMKKLNWKGLNDFLAAERKPLYPPSGVKDKNTGAFVKAHDNLEMYYIMKAGHMVPTDAGEMALEMVERVITG